MNRVWCSILFESVKNMKRKTTISILGGLVLGAAALSARADVQDNPAPPIVARNAFGLRPPGVQGSVAGPPPAQAVDVLLTGIVTLGNTRKVLLEITEKGPGRKPVFPPPLTEGEARNGVEVVSIDPEKSRVVIRSGGKERILNLWCGMSNPSPPKPPVVVPGQKPNEIQARLKPVSPEIAEAVDGKPSQRPGNPPIGLEE
jgi:hypothetical protein